MFKLRTTSTIPKNLTTSKEEEKELQEIFKEYYTNAEKLEEAENSNKVATIRRLTEELQFIGDAITREIVKILELEKTKSFSSKKMQKILGNDIEKKYDEIKSVIEEKNKTVKSQRFDEAAQLRDREKALQTSFLDSIISKKPEIRKNLASTEDSIKEDFALISILYDITTPRGGYLTRKIIDQSFVEILFLKFSKDFGYISDFRFQDRFEKFKSKIIPFMFSEITRHSNEGGYEKGKMLFEELLATPAIMTKPIYSDLLKNLK